MQPGDTCESFLRTLTLNYSRPPSGPVTTDPSVAKPATSPSAGMRTTTAEALAEMVALGSLCHPSLPPRKVRAYVSGPYTLGDVERNVELAIAAGDRLAENGIAVFIPHLSHYWHARHPHDYEFWMEQDLAWIPVCDCLLRLPGTSSGATREVAMAQALGIPVFFSEWALTCWAKGVACGEA